jgi:ribonuclease HII
MTQCSEAEVQAKLQAAQFIIGADECGTGSLCCELVVCAVKAPKDWTMLGLNDSKKLSETKRESLRPQILNAAALGQISYVIASRSNLQIDSMGYTLALRSAYEECFTSLFCANAVLVADGTLKFQDLFNEGKEVYSVIKADGKFPAVMAASILGKTYRDDRMKNIYHHQYPIYNWAANKGYPNPEHLALIEKHGYCPLHRMSYKPMKNMPKQPDPKQLLLFPK